MLAPPIHRSEVWQARSNHRSRIRSQNDKSSRKEHQTPDLGHSKPLPQVPKSHNFRIVKAGQEAYISITRSYYKAAAGALVVYDITR